MKVIPVCVTLSKAFPSDSTIQQAYDTRQKNMDRNKDKLNMLRMRKMAMTQEIQLQVFTGLSCEDSLDQVSK